MGETRSNGLTFPTAPVGPPSGAKMSNRCRATASWPEKEGSGKRQVIKASHPLPDSTQLSLVYFRDAGGLRMMQTQNPKTSHTWPLQAEAVSPCPIGRSRNHIAQLHQCRVVWVPKSACGAGSSAHTGVLPVLNNVR